MRGGLRIKLIFAASEIANVTKMAKASRRTFALSVVATAAMPIFSVRKSFGAGDELRHLSGRFRAIEIDSGGRLGVAVVDTQNGGRAGYREIERFPMCSTFKLLAASGILRRVDEGRESLSRHIRFEAKDLVEYSPVTKDRTGGDGMTLSELCEAAITRSDNTAGNMLLNALDGPQGFTAFARGLGDGITRLDRIEPDLNEAAPGDVRDTTSPDAMATNLRKLVIGDALSLASRSQLTEWLLANKTGDARLRAGLPVEWRVGDKTGSGDWGTTNDIGVVWPPHRQALIICVYLTDTPVDAERRNAIIAAVGRAIASA